MWCMWERHWCSFNAAWSSGSIQEYTIVAISEGLEERVIGWYSHCPRCQFYCENESNPHKQCCLKHKCCEQIFCPYFTFLVHVEGKMNVVADVLSQKTHMLAVPISYHHEFD